MTQPLNPRDEKAVRTYLKRLGPTFPLYRQRYCADPKDLNLKRRDFQFRGKEREVVVTVVLQERAMVMLLQAMLKAPTIQVTGTTFGSYRSCALQKELYDKYLYHEGYLAAPPGRSGHNQGGCADLYKPTAAERRAMLQVGWYDLYPADPPHFNAIGGY